MLIELEGQEKELLESLGAVRASIRQEKLRIIEQQFGVRVGSIVKDRQGKEYKITTVSSRSSGKPWVEGNPRKKDGSFGIANRNIFGEWELVAAN